MAEKCERNAAFRKSAIPSLSLAEPDKNRISVWVETPLAFSLWLVKKQTSAFVPGFAFIFLVAVVETVIASPVLNLILVATALFMTCKMNTTRSQLKVDVFSSYWMC